MGNLKIFDIKDLCVRYNLKTFVETGTLYGDTVDYIYKLNLFDTIYSIEIVDSLAEKAKERFKDIPNIHIYKGSSVDILPQILPNITNNTLFWLDAHFPGADAGLVRYEDVITDIPLKDEISIISKRIGVYKDVIIIDDLRIFEEGNYECGIWLNLKRGLEFINVFNKTHNIAKLYRHEGYLLLTPV